MEKLNSRFLRLTLPVVVAAGAALAAHAESGKAEKSNTPGAGASATSQKATGNYRAIRASELMGREVRGSEGSGVGEIEDLVVDISTGQLRYAMLGFDPGLLSTERLVPIPMSRLRMDTGRDTLVYEATREEMERTAAARSEWNDSLFADKDHIARIEQGYGVKGQGQGSQSLRMVSNLLGKQVNDRARQSVGELEDLVVDTARKRVHYVVVELDASWAGMDKRVALPLRSLRVVQGQDALVLHADKARLQQMPAFGKDQYANLNDRSLRERIDRLLANADVNQPGNRAAAANDTRAAGASGSNATSGSAR